VTRELLTTKSAARQMGVADSTIRSWVQKGWLTVAMRSEGKSFYWRDDLLRAELRARRGPHVADPS
jgi:excisionase family DNA binding protein